MYNVYTRMDRVVLAECLVFLNYIFVFIFYFIQDDGCFTEDSSYINVKLLIPPPLSLITMHCNYKD